MILQALARMAETEQLVPDPDFEVKPVAWVLKLSNDGKLVTIVPRRTDANLGTKRKPKLVGNPMLVPRQFYRSGIKPAAYFLVDNPKFVLGRAVGSADFGADEGQPYRARFCALLNECFEATHSKPLAAVLKFYETLGPEPSAVDLPDDMAANDFLAFQVGLSHNPVHLEPEVIGWWKARSARRGEGDADKYQCLVTGERFAEVRQFPQIEKVPGSAKPIKLISFNASAFESYGLDRNENAAVSPEAAVKVATALNRLLDPAYPNPHDPQQTLPKRNVRLGADTVACLWTVASSTDAQSATNAIPGLLAGSLEDRAANAYESVWRGKPTRINEPAALYVLILTGAQGRATVRDWIETTLGETMQHLAEHFADLEIVRNARPKKGSVAPLVTPLNWLMDCLAPEGNSSGAPPSVEAAFARAALTGSPYPFQLLQRALVRTRAEAGRDEWIDAVRRDARAAIIRAVLNRRRRSMVDSKNSIIPDYPEVPVALNPDLDSAGYSLGALMAVLERLQQAALGNVNASVIDRYFSAASATPRQIFVRLLRNARNHARKAADSDEPTKRGLAHRLDRIIDFFCSRFEIQRKQYPYVAKGLPAHLDLEQQGLFVIGYHQMRHWLWMSKDERAAWEADHPDVAAVFRYGRMAPDDPAEVAS